LATNGNRFPRLVLPTVAACAVESRKAGLGAGRWQTGRMTVLRSRADRGGSVVARRRRCKSRTPLRGPLRLPPGPQPTAARAEAAPRTLRDERPSADLALLLVDRPIRQAVDERLEVRRQIVGEEVAHVLRSGDRRRVAKAGNGSCQNRSPSARGTRVRVSGFLRAGQRF
jgi:hypothetical protein